MDPRFLPAQQALSRGDVEELINVLSANPELAIARSSCDHPTLMQCLVLHKPVVDSLERLIRILAEHGSELTNPLIAAASGNNVRAILELIHLGGDINGNGNWSPLEEALYWVHPASVEVLLHRGAAVDNLRKGAGFGQMDVIASCFDEDGALNAQAGEVAWPFGDNIPEQIRSDRQQIVDNALIYGAAWGQIAAVDELLKRGANVNSIPAGFDFAGTALHYAALQGLSEMADHLLDRGANPAAVDSKIRKMPENWAAHGGHSALGAYLRTRREQGTSESRDGL
ncbi:MAG TPA: ankyrin repeat domain-containing protein [Planctomycetaceae bacterium]|jgi:ankyrin repeat protein